MPGSSDSTAVSIRIQPAVDGRCFEVCALRDNRESTIVRLQCRGRVLILVRYWRPELRSACLIRSPSVTRPLHFGLIRALEEAENCSASESPKEKWSLALG